MEIRNGMRLGQRTRYYDLSKPTKQKEGDSDGELRRRLWDEGQREREVKGGVDGFDREVYRSVAVEGGGGLIGLYL